MALTYIMCYMHMWSLEYSAPLLSTGSGALLLPRLCVCTSQLIPADVVKVTKFLGKGLAFPVAARS